MPSCPTTIPHYPAGTDLVRQHEKGELQVVQEHQGGERHISSQITSPPDESAKCAQSYEDGPNKKGHKVKREQQQFQAVEAQFFVP